MYSICYGRFQEKGLFLLTVGLVLMTQVCKWMGLNPVRCQCLMQSL